MTSHQRTDEIARGVPASVKTDRPVKEIMLAQRFGRWAWLELEFIKVEEIN